MSIKTWQAEFYPIPAKRVAKRDAVAHELRLHRGMLKTNMRKHGCAWRSGSVVDHAEHGFAVSIDTSALCFHRLQGGWDCDKCPCSLLRDGYSCCDYWHYREWGGQSPYELWCDVGDARPMVRLLEKALKYEQDKKRKKSKKGER